MGIGQRASDYRREEPERRSFPAQYGGRCPQCGDEICEGDMICYDEFDQVVHEDCA